MQLSTEGQKFIQQLVRLNFNQDQDLTLIYLLRIEKGAVLFDFNIAIYFYLCL